jgi:signal transduction histidine kinase
MHRREGRSGSPLDQRSLPADDPSGAEQLVAPGTRAHVRVGAARKEGLWRFTVDDNGIGIEPRRLERVFGMFQRLQTRDEFPGTGIGLAIAKKVVEQHRGVIRALGRPEGGTRFEFTLADPPGEG